MITSIVYKMGHGWSDPLPENHHTNVYRRIFFWDGRRLCCDFFSYRYLVDILKYLFLNILIRFSEILAMSEGKSPKTLLFTCPYLMQLGGQVLENLFSDAYFFCFKDISHRAHVSAYVCYVTH